MGNQVQIKGGAIESTGDLDSGSITSGFGNIDIGSSSITCGPINGTNIEGTLTTINQPNIISVGTLINLTVDGDATINNSSGNNILKVNTTNGYIGINKSNPTESLDINGNVKISGNLTFDSNDIDNRIAYLDENNTLQFVGAPVDKTALSYNGTTQTLEWTSFGNISSSGIDVNSLGILNTPLDADLYIGSDKNNLFVSNGVADFFQNVNIIDSTLHIESSSGETLSITSPETGNPVITSTNGKIDIESSNTNGTILNINNTNSSNDSIINFNNSDSTQYSIGYDGSLNTFQICDGNFSNSSLLRITSNKITIGSSNTNYDINNFNIAGSFYFAKQGSNFDYSNNNFGGTGPNIRIGDYMYLGHTRTNNFPYIAFNGYLSSSTYVLGGTSYNKWKDKYHDTDINTKITLITANISGGISIKTANTTGNEIEENGYETTNNFTNIVHIGDTGNIGIGTTNPSAKLHIRSNTTGQNSLLILENNTTTWGGNDDGASIEFRTYETGNGMTRSQAKILIADPTLNNSGYADLVFQTRGIVLGESDPSVTEKMRISNSGNVGIGTNDPSSELHVNGNGEILRLQGSNHSYISFYPQGNTTRHAFIGVESPLNVNHFTISNEASGDIIFRTTNTNNERMRILNSGNVEIGGDVEIGGTVEIGGNVDLNSSSSNNRQFIGYGTIPIGGIIMWNNYNGETVPDGWALCNGQLVNGVQTPDLRGRFVMSSTYGSFNVAGEGSTTYAVGNTGGEQQVTLTTAEIPSHSHEYQDAYRLEHHGYNAAKGDQRRLVNDVGTNSSEKNTSNTGGGGSHENRPPYFVLAYIMRIR